MTGSTQLPSEATVFGSGAGALTIAAELGLKGVSVTVADFPEFFPLLRIVAARGSVEYRCDWHGSAMAPIAGVSDDPAAAARAASLLIVSVPSFGHVPFAEALAPALQDGQTLLWAGEGGGAFTTVAALRRLGRRPALLLGETNTLPYGTRVKAPGAVAAFRKLGGCLVAALPSGRRGEILSVASHIWPWVSGAESAWETLLLNYNAIDHVATLLCNLGSVEGRTGKMLLWGEGATPGVVNAIEAVDGELLALREGLGISNRRGYIEYLVEQGLVESMKGSLHETIHASQLGAAPFPCGPAALQSRYLTEDVPYALVLASSIGDEIGVETPLIDGLIALASAVTKRDWRAAGRTLLDWGLADVGLEGLRRAGEEGWW